MGVTAGQVVKVTYRCTRCHQSVTLTVKERPKVAPSCHCGFTTEGKPRKPAQAMTEEEA